MQIEIPFNIHQHENNPVSQAKLEQKRLSLTGKCLIVLKVMLNGFEIWSDEAETRCFDENGFQVMVGTGVKISSLPRRIKDLKEMGIADFLSYEDNKDGYRHWFIRPEHREQVLMYLMSKATIRA